MLGGAFLARGLLAGRDRELVVLRTAWRTGSAYEWGQHVLIVATSADVAPASCRHEMERLEVQSVPEIQESRSVRQGSGSQKLSASRSVRVTVPSDPPVLTPGAARALLEVLRDLHERVGLGE